MSKLIDLTGQRFGRLIVIERAENGNHNKARWVCQCDCGSKTIAATTQLKTNRKRSCGCLQRDRAKEANTTHGLRKHPLYRVHRAMIDRCENPENKSFHDYGGRGISVCDEWRMSVKAFYDWAILNGYHSGVEIDRINNDGPYSPENCRFVTKAANKMNRRNSLLVEYCGNRVPLRDLADEFGIKYTTAYYRYKQGLPVEEIFERKRL